MTGCEERSDSEHVLKIDNGFVDGFDLESMRKRVFENDLTVLF